jgi:hypothetical protein
VIILRPFITGFLVCLAWAYLIYQIDKNPNPYIFYEGAILGLLYSALVRYLLLVLHILVNGLHPIPFRLHCLISFLIGLIVYPMFIEGYISVVKLASPNH